jgi:drug/metabolite transporter (DMT)-like permease
MGYREHSYDPNVYEQQGAPLRPFNWVQWTGVAIGVLGLILTTINVLGQLGWIHPWFNGSQPFFVLLLLGLVLVNSRRDPSTTVGSEQLARNRKVLALTVAILAAILGAAAVIQFSGA